MPLVLIILWFLLNGRVTWDVAVSGAAAAAAVYFCACRFLGWSPARDLRFLRRGGLIAVYFVRLAGSILAANLEVARIILSPRCKSVQPALLVFDMPVKTRYGRLLLANSITLTPGTITVGMRDGRCCVHGLDRSMLQGLEESGFVQQIKRMEGDGRG